VLQKNRNTRLFYTGDTSTTGTNKHIYDLHMSLQRNAIHCNAQGSCTWATRVQKKLTNVTWLVHICATTHSLVGARIYDTTLVHTCAMTCQELEDTTYVYICIYIRVCVYTYIYIYIHIHMNINMYIYICIYTYIDMCVCMYVHIYIYIYIYITTH